MAKKQAAENSILDEALMSWKSKIQRDHLKSMQQPYSGKKEVLVRQTMGCIHMERSMGILNKYITYLDTQIDTSFEEMETGNENDEENAETDVVR